MKVESQEPTTLDLQLWKLGQVPIPTSLLRVSRKREGHPEHGRIASLGDPNDTQTGDCGGRAKDSLASSA
jgi:hypothetical protein